MAALHSLLALYGAFDQSVVEANDPGWTARVAQFLPATTGENQRGWFSEVKRLVDQLAPDVSAAQFPGVEAALDDLTAVANVISAFRDPLTEPSDNDPPLLDDDRHRATSLHLRGRHDACAGRSPDKR